MKLSKVTLEILKNLATINPGIVIRPGNKLSTMNIMKSVFVSATVPDEFPIKFAIYDLNELLTSISAFNTPDIEFLESYMVIRGDNDEVEYSYSSETVVVSPGDKKIALPSEDKKFTLSKVNLDRIMKFASIHKLKDLKIDDSTITLLNRNGTGNKYKIKMEITSGDDSVPSFMSVEKLNFIPVDYAVSISNKKISRFTSMSSDYPIEYFCTLDVSDEK